MARAKYTHRLVDDEAEESTNKRAYQPSEVWKKVIRREPQRCFCVPSVGVGSAEVILSK